MPANSKSDRSDTEELFLLAVAVVGVAAGAAVAVTFWHHIVTWSLAHRVLLPRSADPLARVPGAGGAGLDLPRLALLVAALLVVATLTLTAIRRHQRCRDGEEG